MSVGNRSIIYSQFYCPLCGNKAMDLPRKRGHQHSRFHRKKLYCFNCQKTINCIECKTPEDIIVFRANYLAGDFQEEVENDLNETYVPSGLFE